jgi:hypothetical protein
MNDHFWNIVENLMLEDKATNVEYKRAFGYNITLRTVDNQLEARELLRGHTNYYISVLGQYGSANTPAKSPKEISAIIAELRG